MTRIRPAKEVPDVSQLKITQVDRWTDAIKGWRSRNGTSPISVKDLRRERNDCVTYIMYELNAPLLGRSVISCRNTQYMYEYLRT